MGLVRRLLAGLLLATAALGVSSASSLGTFDDVALSAVADATPTCTGDAALVDGLTSGIIPLSAPSLYAVEAVSLTGLEGDCAGLVPVVVVIGQDPWPGGDVVLAVQDFPDDALAGTGDVTLAVDPGDVLDLLTLDLTTVATEVRVAFCPVGATCG